ncbi:MAG: NlpC/P60 family protein, partial [Chloroflexota bacterium]
QPGTMLTSIINTYQLGRYDAHVPSSFGAGAAGNPVVAAPPLPSGLPGPVAQAVTWGENAASTAAYGDFQCEQFVENAYRTGGLYPTALAAESGPAFHQGGLAGAQVGDIVYFKATSDNKNDGHAAIYLGGDTMLSTSPWGVQPISISWWERESAGIAGWRAPFTANPPSNAA